MSRHFCHFSCLFSFLLSVFIQSVTPCFGSSVTSRLYLAISSFLSVSPCLATSLFLSLLIPSVSLHSVCYPLSCLCCPRLLVFPLIPAASLPSRVAGLLVFPLLDSSSHLACIPVVASCLSFIFFSNTSYYSLTLALSSSYLCSPCTLYLPLAVYILPLMFYYFFFIKHYSLTRLPPPSCSDFLSLFLF